MKCRSKYIDPALLIAVEFGVMMAEKGHNVQDAKAEFVKIRSASGAGHRLHRLRPEDAPLPAVGSWVRLRKGRSIQSAKVITHMKDVEGGLQLDRRLDGFAFWNKLDVRPAAPNPLPLEKS